MDVVHKSNVHKSIVQACEAGCQLCRNLILGRWRCASAAVVPPNVLVIGLNLASAGHHGPNYSSGAYKFAATIRVGVVGRGWHQRHIIHKMLIILLVYRTAIK